jgi:hypothetical protein
MARRLPAGVHDVAQPLTRIHIVLSCGKAIPILANRALKVSLSSKRGIHASANFSKQIVPRAGLDLLRGSAQDHRACYDRRDQE